MAPETGARQLAWGIPLRGLPMGVHVVTGAYGYSGRYIAARLLDRGETVRTLTNSPDRPNPFGGRVRAERFHFAEPERLVAAMRGADVLYNTYWVRFDYGDFSHALAVENTLKLFRAARQAGVRRVVHVSITNPSEWSDLGYFSGKARLESALVGSGLSYAILRPALLFGREDVLLNNIAWTLRRLPVFGIFGDGMYRLQPIYVDDLAALAVREGRGDRNVIIDAIGPETFTFRGLVEAIGAIINRPRPIIPLPPALGYVAATLVGKIVGDVLLTRDEIKGLMRGLLCTASEPVGKTRLTDWARRHAATLGVRYASELARRLRRDTAYEDL